MNNNNKQQFQQNMQMGSGLTRYRSAPSSCFASLLNSDNSSCDAGFGEDEFEHLFCPQDSIPETRKILSGFISNSDATQENSSFKMSSHFLTPRSSESAIQQPHVVYQRNHSDAANAALQESYSRLIGSINSNQMKIEEDVSESSCSLIRHSSSPAGLFNNRNVINNEFGANRVTYPTNSWDDSVLLSDDFLKGMVDNDQRNESGNRSRALLSHNQGVPKSCNDLSAIEKLMQDSVPCKIRAKRGFATHPRSIAERVRRTKISERMRKLQELVPNMEKQTNTADMLDLAVEYIKDLQIQVKKLTEDHAKCSCLNKEIP